MMKCSTKKFSALLFALLLLFSPASALAADKTENQRAAEIAMKAVRLYRNGQNQEAAKLFMEAYAISKRPAQMRNAAKAYEEGGMLDQSAELWQRYRDHVGVNKDERSEADAHLKLIQEKKKNAEMAKAAQAAQQAAEAASRSAEQARAQAEAASKQATLVQETRVQEESGPSVPPLVLIGTGAGAAIAGGVLWFVAGSQVNKLDDRIGTTNEQGLITGISRAEIDDEVSGINTTRVVSGVLLSAGAAALVSGVLWLILDES